MRVLAIVHQGDSGPGVFAEAIEARGAEFEQWHIAQSEPAPGDPAEYDAVLTFGGAMHADEQARHRWLADEKAVLARLLERRVPLLGVCLGAQLVSEAAGAPARRALQPEIGWYEVELTAEGVADPLLAPLQPGFEAFEWHSYEFPLAPGAVALARSATCLQAYRVGEHAWGIQFHAEVTGADVEGWIADYRTDDDAVRMRLDVDRLRTQTRAAIDAWNELGRALCERFLDAAGGATRA